MTKITQPLVVAKLLNRFKADGYEKVSLSELLYSVKGYSQVKDVVKAVKSLGYRTTVNNGETFILLNQKVELAKAHYCSLPRMPALFETI